MELRAILAQTKLRLDEVLALQQGDLITTDVPVDAPIPLNMDKQSLRFGRLGELNGRRAFELIDRPLDRRRRAPIMSRAATARAEAAKNAPRELPRSYLKQST